MYEHFNDEILSYMYHGNMLHEDSYGKSELISPTKNVQMGAEKSFFHQESASRGTNL
jgi:quercetin 2,3-dioxygenase